MAEGAFQDIDMGLVVLLTVFFLAGAYLIVQGCGAGTPKADPEEEEWLKVYPRDYKPDAPRAFLAADLKEFDGTDGKRLYVAAKGVVFDVGVLPSGWKMYGKKGPYHLFAARDASWALAKMSLDPSGWPKHASWDDLDDDEKQTLDEWVKKFKDEKGYPVVGWVTDGLFPRRELPSEL